MIQTEYVVLTPAGKFVAQWDENQERPVVYAGNASAVDFFHEFMRVANVTGAGGIAIDPDNLEPEELIGFCQSEEYGVLVLTDAEDALAEMEARADIAPTLDSVTADSLARLESAASALEKVAAASVIAKSLSAEEVAGSGVRTISAQRFVDDEIVARKLEDQDFEVAVSPNFEVDGWGMVRVVTDGHHSMAAAKLAGVQPKWIEQDARDNDTIALLSRGDQGIDDFLTIHRIDSDYYDVETGIDL